MYTISVLDVLYGVISKYTNVTIHGWIRTCRVSNTKFVFIDLYDGSCLDSLQIIANDTLLNYKNEILRLTSGCSIKVIGDIIQSIGKKQHVELVATKIEVLGWIDKPDTYPIAAKKHTLEYLRSVAHLKPRTHIIGAITRIRNTIFQSIHNIMDKKGFLWIPTPIITASDTEGNSKMFYISDNKQISNDIYLLNKHTKQFFFGKETFLTVSGQLNLEAYACAVSKVYTFGPTFRAEHSNTNRHLAEFWMIEPEIAFANLNDVIILAESLLKDIIKILLNKNSRDIEYCSNQTKKNSIIQLEKMMNSEFIRINYTDAINILKSCNKNFDNTVYWGIDLFSEHEKFLSEEYFKAPVVVLNYPKNIKAFYMRLNDDNKTVSSMDILVPGIGEIIGGSQREERLSILDKRLSENNLSIKDYWWYRDLRRYGTVPHSGFGLGFERLIMYITGMYNIRDVVPFYRTFRSINF